MERNANLKKAEDNWNLSIKRKIGQYRGLSQIRGEVSKEIIEIDETDSLANIIVSPRPIINKTENTSQDSLRFLIENPTQPKENTDSNHGVGLCSEESERNVDPTVVPSKKKVRIMEKPEIISEDAEERKIQEYEEEIDQLMYENFELAEEIEFRTQKSMKEFLKIKSLDVIKLLREQEEEKKRKAEEVEIYCTNLKLLYTAENKIPEDYKMEEVRPWEWEIVIACRNPDSMEEEEMLTYEQAEEIYTRCFKFFKSTPTQIEGETEKQELLTFKKCFQQLTNAKPGFKKNNLGGRFLQIQNSDPPEYMQTEEKCSDMRSLVLNIIMAKLANALSLKTQLMMSENGQNIFLLIKADESDITTTAMNIRYNAQLEIGYTDLSSLEPCNEDLRQFRTLKKPESPLGERLVEKEYRLRKLYAFIDRDIESLDEQMPDVNTPKQVRIRKKFGVLAENRVSTLEWEIYDNYLDNLIEGFDSFLDDTDHNPSLTGFYLMRICKRSLRRANTLLRRQASKKKVKKFKLKTVWDRLNVDHPFGAFNDYIQRDEEGEDKFDKFWKRHKVNELGHRFIFSNMDRIQILFALIETQLVPSELEERGYIEGIFPLHNTYELNGIPRFDVGREREMRDIPIEEQEMNELFRNPSEMKRTKPCTGLFKEWKFSFRAMTKVPSDTIRNYFGEKIAMYFSWIGLYTKYLIIVSVIGIPIYIFQHLIIDEEKHKEIFLFLTISYCFLSLFWSTFFLEHWKRKEIKMAVKWGQLDFEDDEVVRPKFIGESRRSPVSDELNEKWYSPVKRRKKILIGFLVSFAMILAVVAITITIFYLRGYFLDKYSESYMFYSYIPAIATILITFQIIIFNILYEKLALFLTNYENHRTFTEYESSLISKTFLFQFVNSYLTLIYIAFIKRDLEGCLGENDEGRIVTSDEYSCVGELTTQLTSIFIVNIFKNLLEVGIPWIKNKKRERKLKKSLKKKKKATEEGLEEYAKLRHAIQTQFDLEDYQHKGIDGTYSEYLEMIIQFGFTLLFAIAFPLAPFLASFNNIIEIQVDKYKVTKLVRRPRPRGGRSIGIWYRILYGMSCLAIVSNVGIICFTSAVFDRKTDEAFKAFTFGSLFLIGIKYIIGGLIPDLPKNVHIILARHSNIVAKYLENKKETEVDQFAEKVNYLVDTFS